MFRNFLTNFFTRKPTDGDQTNKDAAAIPAVGETSSELPAQSLQGITLKSSDETTKNVVDQLATRIVDLEIDGGAIWVGQDQATVTEAKVEQSQSDTQPQSSPGITPNAASSGDALPGTAVANTVVSQSHHATDVTIGSTSSVEVGPRDQSIESAVVDAETVLIGKQTAQQQSSVEANAPVLTRTKTEVLVTDDQARLATPSKPATDVVSSSSPSAGVEVQQSPATGIDASPTPPAPVSNSAPAVIGDQPTIATTAISPTLVVGTTHDAAPTPVSPEKATPLSVRPAEITTSSRALEAAATSSSRSVMELLLEHAPMLAPAALQAIIPSLTLTSTSASTESAERAEKNLLPKSVTPERPELADAEVHRITEGTAKWPALTDQRWSKIVGAKTRWVPKAPTPTRPTEPVSAAPEPALAPAPATEEHAPLVRRRRKR